MSKLRHAIEAKRSVLSKDIDFLIDHDNCPTCKQLIDPKFREDTVATKRIEINTIDDGLIYTDPLFLEEFKLLLAQESLDNSDISYSEQGMQGDDYVSFDVGYNFLKSWL